MHPGILYAKPFSPEGRPKAIRKIALAAAVASLIFCSDGRRSAASDAPPGHWSIEKDSRAEFVHLRMEARSSSAASEHLERFSVFEHDEAGPGLGLAIKCFPELLDGLEFPVVRLGESAPVDRERRRRPERFLRGDRLRGVDVHRRHEPSGTVGADR